MAIQLLQLDLLPFLPTSHLFFQPISNLPWADMSYALKCLLALESERCVIFDKEINYKLFYNCLTKMI